MSRPDPIHYAERLYAAIRAANFSTLSFLAFGNAVKDGVELRRIPRIAAEPFMRVVGEMLDMEEQAEHDIIDADAASPNLVASQPSLDETMPKPARTSSAGETSEVGDAADMLAAEPASTGQSRGD